jgi:regulatory protein YycI of two-component signal transduction system YycFG
MNHHKNRKEFIILFLVIIVFLQYLLYKEWKNKITSVVKSYYKLQKENQNS